MGKIFKDGRIVETTHEGLDDDKSPYIVGFSFESTPFQGELRGDTVEIVEPIISYSLKPEEVLISWSELYPTLLIFNEKTKDFKVITLDEEGFEIEKNFNLNNAEETLRGFLIEDHQRDVIEASRSFLRTYSNMNKKTKVR